MAGNGKATNYGHVLGVSKEGTAVYKARFQVVAAVLLVAVCLGMSSPVRAGIQNSEKETIINKVLADSAKMSKASADLSEAMAGFVSGTISETEVFYMVVPIYREVNSLREQATARLFQFNDKYPLGTYTNNEDVDIFMLVNASFNQARSLFDATVIALERFRTRDMELSDVEKRTLENLISVNQELSSVYGFIIELLLSCHGQG